MTRSFGAIATMLLVLAACTSDRTTKSEFIARGDQLCRGLNQSVEQVQVDGDPFSAGISQAERDRGLRLLGHLAGAIPQLTNDLRNLGIPKESAKLEKMLSELERAGLEFEQATKLYQTGDLPGAKARADLGFGRLEAGGAAAQEYGFNVCDGRNGDAEESDPTPAGPQVAVLAKEYAFEFPPEAPAGPVVFAINNAGQERHSLSVIKLHPGVSAEEAMEANKTGRDSQGFIEKEVGSSPRAIPGQTVTFATDLSPGPYAYACFVVALDGQPHAYKGMFGQFRVP